MEFPPTKQHSPSPGAKTGMILALQAMHDDLVFEVHVYSPRTRWRQELVTAKTERISNLDAMAHLLPLSTPRSFGPVLEHHHFAGWSGFVRSLRPGGLDLHHRNQE